MLLSLVPFLVRLWSGREPSSSRPTSSSVTPWGWTALTVVGYATFQVLRRYYKMLRSPLRHLPGPPRANFWTGYFVDIYRQAFLAPHKRWFQDLHRPPLFQYTGILGRYTVVVMDPNIVQQILTDSSIVLSSPRSSSSSSSSRIRFPKRYRFLQQITGDGLVTLEGPAWSRHRRILQPAFQTTALQRTLDVCVPTLTGQLMEAWRNAGPHRVIDVQSHLSALTLDIIGRVAFSHDFKTLAKLHQWVHSESNNDANLSDEDKAVMDQATDPLIRTLHESMRLSFVGVLVNVLNIPWAESYLKRSAWRRRILLNAATDEIIEAAKRKNNSKDTESDTCTTDNEQDDSSPHKSLLQLLLEARSKLGVDGSASNRNALSDVELRDECKTFIVAGHETTSTWCYWALYALALYPSVQERLYQEMIKASPPTQDSTTPVLLHLKDVEKMEYLSAFLEEVLRFYSPVGMLIRFNAQEEHWDGYTIPPNTRLVLPFHMLQRHPDYWNGDDPETFSPDRWLNGPAKRHPFVHIPFSAGGRNCIGQRFAQMEAMLIIANLVRAFVVRLAPGTEGEKLELTSNITIKSKTPIRICVEPR